MLPICSDSSFVAKRRASRDDLIHQLVFSLVMRVSKFDGLLAEDYAVPTDPTADPGLKPDGLRPIVAVYHAEEERMESRIFSGLGCRIAMARNWDCAIKIPAR